MHNIRVMQSYVIIGTRGSSRAQDIRARIEKLGVSPFDIVTPANDTPSIGISDIKVFIKNLTLLPQHGTTSAGVIADASLLTPEAQQALLKTLEEPPSHAVIFLGTSNTSELLPTVISRCQCITISDDTPRVGDTPNETIKLLDVLLASSAGRKLSHLQSVGKTREEVDRFIDQAMLCLRTDILQNGASSTSEREKLALVRRLLWTKQYSGNNVNSLLLLEHVLLTLR